ncbi:cobalamin biosynthesis protein CbiD [Candidatus Bathyarchaeota archaeon A05DMB-2]|jgi:cobalt-precorrin-5B (C1)-methyltransferase|nr:cobalamin biosynthesis protein CbiD [Candidatus Bathyarchaeota archaeon A05DMB-2]
MARFLKYGITTGASATAAAKAALITLLSGPVDRVVIPTPIGLRFEIPVKECRKLDDATALAVVVKDAGEDIDATNGLEISATVRLTDDGKVTITNGQGIGTVTKPGLQVPVGEPAINPMPKRMITEAVKEMLPAGKGAEVVVSAPEGEKVAEKTLNAKLGVVGGISVLGTTGVVKPYSLEACRRSMVPQIDIALACGYKRIFVVPGNIGEKITRQFFKVPEEAIVQTGDFMGYMLDKAVEKGVQEIVLLGHPGKLVKLAAGIFNTHHKVADARNEVIAAYAGAAGADTETINAVLQANTTEEAAEILKRKNLSHATFDKIAQRVNSRVAERTGNKAKISVIIVSMGGQVLGMDENARCAETWLNSA